MWFNIFYNHPKLKYCSTSFNLKCSQHTFVYFIAIRHFFSDKYRQSWLYPSLFSPLSPADISLSVFAVTSKSMTVQWSDHTGASSYKITATPKNSPERPVFAHFGGNVVMGSVNSLSPNTVYTMQLDAMDNALNVLSRAETEETTGQWQQQVQESKRTPGDESQSAIWQHLTKTFFTLREDVRFMST